jgi:hypothetical protein
MLDGGTRFPLAEGDQVKITDARHPWSGAIGRIIKPFGDSPEHWVIELETILPGRHAMAHKSEVRRV